MKKTTKKATKKQTRATKKQVYASFGIEWKKGNYIYHPVFGWIKPLLKQGNTKLGKKIFTYSTLAGTIEYKTSLDACHSINGTCNCDCDGCYAKTGRYIFPNVIESNARNTFIARFDMNYLYRAISAQIIADHIDYVRIHAAGDFFNMEYVNVWVRIVKENSNVIFWTYTKNIDAETAFESLPNGNIVKSIIPEIGLNFGKCAYILDTYNTLKAAGESVYICRCGIDKEQHCSDCKGCSVNKYVLFIEHSTDYVAETDPLFETLKKVIESQKKPE